MTVHLCAIPPGEGELSSLAHWFDLLSPGDVVVCYGHGVQSVKWLQQAVIRRFGLQERVRIFVLDGQETPGHPACGAADASALTHERLLDMVCLHGRSCTWK